MKKVLLLLVVLANLKVCSTLYGDGARYLIITHDNFYEAIQPLAEWKHKKGMKTKVVKLSETGSDTSQIKSYIQNAYNTWTPRPEYVLLVGDEEFLPTYWGSGSATDNYYATLQGWDYLSDICIGRFSVDNLSECSTMIAKTLGYEQTPWMQDDMWFRKSALLIRDDHDQGDQQWYYPDIWFTYNLMVQHNYVEIDTIFEKNGCNAGDVIRSVDEGLGFVGYRGTGTGNWHQPFDVAPEVTQNGWMLPIVYSATCNTANFEEEGFICERWTRAGSAAEPKGAVAFVGSNKSGHSSRRSFMWRGFWGAFFDDSIFTLGDAYLAMKQYFYNEFGTAEKGEYEAWHILGDPELNLWTSTPKTLEVSYLHAIPIGASNFTVGVRNNGTPVKSALVCLSKSNEVYAYSSTNAQGEVTLSINPTTADTMWVTVTAHNCRAYEGYAVVISGGAYVHLLKHTIVDTAGNNDGIPNPGEPIVMPLWVKNYGVANAIGVNGVLSTTDAFTTITDNYEFFGNISVSDSAITSESYKFFISSNCPDKHKILFELTCSDTTGSTWLSWFDITVASPVIVISSKAINDAGQANPNGAIDPGETVRLIIALNNSGSAGAEGVNAVLHTDDSYITVSDSSSLYGDILTDSTRNNSSDPYVVSCNSSAPLYHIINFTLLITSTSGYEVTLNFSLKVGLGGDYLVWDPDYRNKSGPVLDSLLNSNGYVGDYTIDLTDYRTYLQKYKSIFICLGVPYYDYTLTPGEDVDALCNYLDNGGRLYMEGANAWAHGERTQLQKYFHIKPYSDGYRDADSILGRPGAFTSGMKFKYSGQNQSMDRIKVANGAWEIFNNSRPSYTNSIAFANGWHKYKTIATSFEFGGLEDGVSTKSALADSIMQWFSRDPWHDVALWRVQNPQYYVVWPQSAFSPVVVVRNIGALQETFKAICTVDSLSQTIYADTVKISNFPAGEEQMVVFDAWNPSTVNNTYAMQFQTELTGDGEPQNNTRNMEVTSFDFARRINSGYTFTMPIIDGEIDTSWEWKDAGRIDISDVLNRTDRGPFPARSVYLYVMNNDSCVYLGFDARWDKSLDDLDGFFFFFDDNHDYFYPAWPDSSEGELIYLYHQLWQTTIYNPMTRDMGELGWYNVDMKSGSAITSGNVQHEFILPLGVRPECLNAGLGDTVGFSVIVGNLEKWDMYGWWPQQTHEPWEPVAMGELVIATASGAEVSDKLPRVFGISQNIPNPFVRKSAIFYQLPVNSKVSLKIYNTAGQLVRTLVDAIEEAGYKRVAWDGKDNTGRHVATGIYLYRFTANSIKEGRGFTNTKKMIFLGK